MKNINLRLDEIVPKITDFNFMNNKGLGNEVGFHIFDYDPKDELLVRESVKNIKDRVLVEYGKKIKEFDIYEIILSMLYDKGFLEKSFAMEEKKGSNYVFKAIRTTSRITLGSDYGLIQKYIKENIGDADIVFLTGVGKAWPIIRSHTVLNNLHDIVEDVPLVMFFPGIYDGGTLMLFNELKDDNYYRAFQLV